ncbi:DUF2972 domain-containing protein [Helicobacter sp.]|uniref:DUF2972 domain-containing protein n=1 Tax=Helicobacter sp. TaxID=218 RepID=UPI0025BC9499|nr:DUF2972 domain-containing protein [Helicobacter sp.]MCI5968167.1 DUF2972 domain-containing protein [Helicobacter sp.]
MEKFGSDREREKYFALVSKSVPALMQVRDPIESLKHGALNWDLLLANLGDLQRDFSLAFDYHYFDKILRIRKATYEPPKDFSYLNKQGPGIWTSLVNALNPQDLVYMDMQEISKDRAFDTLTKLAKHFNFNLPQEKDRKVYEAKHFSGNLFFLWSNAPLVLWVNSKDLSNKYSKKNPKNVLANPNKNFEIIKDGSFRIYFTAPEGHLGVVDIAEHFEDEATQEEITKEAMTKEIGVYMQEGEFKALRKDAMLWEATKEYVNEFLEYLKVESKKAQNERITTEQVLEALKADKEAAKNLEAVLEPSLRHLKKARPDIIKSWKYYQNFKKLCKG